MANLIRNIMQTVGEREIIKTAPDIVVYIEGRPYLINPYINSQDASNQSDGSYTIVNFNDFIDSFSASYDIDNLIPSASISMFVPNNFKRLFQAPSGGNNILETMMEVQVFGKGYFPSPRGNTMYYRIFKGMISNIGYSDTGTNLQINISCLGTLRFLELMQIDLAAALISNASMDYITPYKNNLASMDPYKQLADMFLRSVTPAGFQLNALDQGAINAEQNNPSDWGKAIKQNYIIRWQTKLVNLVKDVRILGYDMKNSPVITEDDPNIITNVLSKEPEDAVGSMDPDMMGARSARLAVQSPGTTRNDKNMYINVMRKYLPDMSVDSIKLNDGKITSRLERLRTVVNLLLYEGFQDLDGAIIFKPPYYNLDVTNIGITNPNAQLPDAADYFTQNTNPFVVHLSEIESESETEDEHSIRCTRMSIQGDWLTNFHFDSEGGILKPVVDHIDIAKLSKFGLREEPARQLPFIQSNHLVNLYAYAASELNRANRAYRTYTITIPMRPEIHLGFPMYFPHKDMYGYIKQVSITYQQGQAANMQITLDTVRKRPLIPSTKTIGTKTVTSYTSQPNLVYQWTKPPDANTPVVNPPGWASQFVSVASSGATPGGNPSKNPALVQAGNQGSVRQPDNVPFSQDEWAYIKQR